MKATKYSIIAIIILLLAAGTASANLLDDLFNFFSDANTVDIYIDGENVTCSAFSLNSSVNIDSLNEEIINYVSNELANPQSNITTIKEGINTICENRGVEDPEIMIDSILGEDKIPVIFDVEGESMVPTLQDGQQVLVEKTKNISVNDIVTANSDEYGPIVKRVDQIDGNSVHLISDNKNVEYIEENGVIYEKRGITTWVDISEIYGIVREY